MEEAEFVEEHRSWVRAYARNVAAKYGRLYFALDADDLYSAGMLEVIRIFRTSVPTTWMKRHVWQAMLMELRRMDCHSNHTQRLRLKYTAAVNEQTKKLNRPPTSDELAAALGVDLTRIEVIRIAIQAGETALPYINPKGYFDRSCPMLNGYDCVADAELKSAVEYGMTQLQRRDADIIRMYFDDELNHREIGLKLGLSQQRVYALFDRGMKRLKKVLESKGVTSECLKR